MNVKLKIILLLSVLLSCSKSYDKAKDSFFVTSEEVEFKEFRIESFNQTGKYFFLCKTWGFLKYHHTNIKNGELDWDVVLFQTIKQVQSNPTKKEYEKIILNLISQAGSIELSKQTIKLDKKNYLNVNHKWFNNTTYLSKEIKEELLKIKQNNISYGDQHYVKTTITGNLEFTNEKEYSEESILNSEIRILGLFRYWNVINYFYPYKYDLDKNWDNILYEYIPRFITCNNELDYNYLFAKLTTEIDDSHVKIKSKILQRKRAKYLGNFNVLAIDSFWIVNEFRVKGKKSNIHIGDVILKLNAKPIQFYYDSLKPFISASNESTLKRDASLLIFRTNQVLNKLTVIRNEDTLVLDEVFFEGEELWNQHISERRSFARKNVGSIIDEGIGYIKLEQVFCCNQDMSFDWMFAKTNAIILDIRGYPNEEANNVIKKFINKKVHFWNCSYSDIDFPGSFRINRNTSLIGGDENIEIYKGLLIVLVNENTQSQAEFSAMVFQTVPRMKIIGTQTAGADGNITVIGLPGEIKTSFSGIGVFYPNMKPTQRVGIIPDIYVKRTVNGIINGEDEILQAAISYIKNQKEKL
tara:strand:+ start:214 stop:1956 length:1743 start_codon:yes stop_codon:yes gene_type:complete